MAVSLAEYVNNQNACVAGRAARALAVRRFGMEAMVAVIRCLRPRAGAG